MSGEYSDSGGSALGGLDQQQQVLENRATLLQEQNRLWGITGAGSGCGMGIWLYKQGTNVGTLPVGQMLTICTLGVWPVD